MQIKLKIGVSLRVVVCFYKDRVGSKKPTKVDMPFNKETRNRKKIASKLNQKSGAILPCLFYDLQIALSNSL